MTYPLSFTLLERDSHKESEISLALSPSAKVLFFWPKEIFILEETQRPLKEENPTSSIIFTFSFLQIFF